MTMFCAGRDVSLRAMCAWSPKSKITLAGRSNDQGALRIVGHVEGHRAGHHLDEDRTGVAMPSRWWFRVGR